jgi:prepilin peptidase CpaA
LLPCVTSSPPLTPEHYGARAALSTTIVIYLHAAALLLALACALTDLTTGKIPNCITLPALAAGLLVGHPLGVLACAPALWLFARGKLAGGDVKLVAALGALVGLTSGLLVLIVAVLCALLTSSRRLGPWALVGVVFVLAS